ncbi:MAG: flagellin lysine-N-methylase [Oscillospiraceae bacterium]|nr:flagellin lysine-N-methylase [Oscillospiraceae bacterium]
MKITKPWFYDKFICIADRCTDNCCIGWEIDIDPPAMERFEKASGEFGERLRSAIHTEGGCPAFALCEGERCALLREDGLCELILNMGEDALCDICALHPRFFGWYNGLKEAGLGLCCEEVCRLMFSDSAPLSFVSGEIDELWEDTCSEELLQLLLSARSEILGMLQDRSCPLAERLYSAAIYTRRLQDILDNGELRLPETVRISDAPSAEKGAAEALMSLYGEMESLNSEWDERYHALSERLAEVTAALPRYLEACCDELWRYEHIAVYFCYRHFLSGVFEGEVVSRMGLVFAAVYSIMLMDCLVWLEKGAVTEWDRILNLKLYSKQVEYSEENTEMLLDAVWENALLSPENIALSIK